MLASLLNVIVTRSVTSLLNVIVTSSVTRCRKQKVTAVTTMKSSMSRLQEQDPEFYEFLRKEDKELLDFDASDDDGSDDDDDGDGTHQLPAKLAVIITI